MVVQSVAVALLRWIKVAAQSPEIYNYPGVISDRDPRALLVASVRKLESTIKDTRAHVYSLEQSLTEKREKIQLCEADIARLKTALDRLSSDD